MSDLKEGNLTKRPSVRTNQGKAIKCPRCSKGVEFYGDGKLLQNSDGSLSSSRAEFGKDTNTSAMGGYSNDERRRIKSRGRHSTWPRTDK